MDLNAKNYSALLSSMTLTQIENASLSSTNTSFPIYLLDQKYSSVNRSQLIKTDKRPTLEKEKDSLHNASKFVITIARCFGLFPVMGVNNKDAEEVYFSWTSKSMLYSLFILSYALLIDGLAVVKTVKTGLTYYNTVDFVFWISLTCIYILSIRLAAKWPNFINEWESIEKHTGLLGYCDNLTRDFKFFSIIMTVLALVEHLCSIVKQVVSAKNCVHKDMDLMKAYFVNTYKHIFLSINYHFIFAIFVSILSLIMSCAWNFMDLFIILMSIAMIRKYKKYNRILQSINRKVMNPIFWRNMREEYNQLSYLTRKLDDLLSPIVLLSFANNLYFICLQLFNSLKPMPTTWHAIYFVYSFSYLVAKTVTVSLIAATIYDQSKQPRGVLFSVPSESFSTEVSRLITQVTSDELALTGCRFFSVTRTLVLTVAGTIVTYEIVLVQFNAVGNNDNDTRMDNNNTFSLECILI